MDSFPLTLPLLEAGSLQRWEAVRDYTQLIVEQMARLEGEPAPTRRSFESPAAAAEHVKGLARAAGAGPVGTTRQRSYHRAQGFEDASPFVAALAMAMRWQKISQAPDVAAGVEVFRVYYELGETVVRLADAMRELGWQATPCHPVSDIGNGSRSRIFFVPAAIDAGLGELGQAGCLVTPGPGIVVRLAAFATDLPMAEDAPRRAGIEECCSLCTACLQACSGGAIATQKSRVGGVLRWQTDPERCFPHLAAHLGCSICMAVCPYALPHVRPNLLERWSARIG